jgi:hypothetical protein
VLPEEQRGVVATVVGVVDEANVGMPIPHRHLHCPHHQLGPRVIGHRPADHTTTERIANHRQIEEVLRGRDRGEIGDERAGRARWR